MPPALPHWQGHRAQGVVLEHPRDEFGGQAAHVVVVLTLSWATSLRGTRR
ncbi:hypothetical protein [uncultured Sphingomonas sp.]